MFPEIDRVKNFLSSAARIGECVSKYISLISKKKPIKTRRQKAKETKKRKRLTVENLTEYDDAVYEFALCTFNLLD